MIIISFNKWLDEKCSCPRAEEDGTPYTHTHIHVGFSQQPVSEERDRESNAKGTCRDAVKERGGNVSNLDLR